MKIDYSVKNTHIENSYLITTRKAIKEEVEEIKSYREMTKRPVSRSTGSYIREWKGHNRLYKWNIKRDHTKDIDLEERITMRAKVKGMFLEVVWLILGGI